MDILQFYPPSIVVAYSYQVERCQNFHCCPPNSLANPYTIPTLQLSDAAGQAPAYVTREERMAAKKATPASLVHPDALHEVFEIIDANGDGVLTVHEFILVRALHAHARATDAGASDRSRLVVTSRARHSAPPQLLQIHLFRFTTLPPPTYGTGTSPHKSFVTGFAQEPRGRPLTRPGNDREPAGRRA